MYSPKFKVWEPSPIVSLRPGAPSPLFEWLAGNLGYLYIRFVMKVKKIAFKNFENLVEAYKDCYEQKKRILIAFRHPGDNDPQLIYYAITVLLRRHFKKMKLSGRPRVLFVASAEIPLWGGPLITWALEKAGTIPLSHGGMSRDSMAIILKALNEEPSPIALAPEGQVSYWSHAEPVLDDGIGQIVLWSQKLASDQKPPLEVLPIGVTYTFPRETYESLHRFICQIEHSLGLGQASLEEGDPDTFSRYFAARFKTIFKTTIDIIEDFYKELGYSPKDFDTLHDRLLAISDFALSKAEAYYGVKSQGDLRSRVMHLRSVSNRHTFRQEKDLRLPTGLKKMLVQRQTKEAYYMHRHQELADLAYYLTDDRITRPLGFDQQVEAAQNLMDLVYRSVGGSFGTRPMFFKKQINLNFGKPIKTDIVESSRKEYLKQFRETLAKAFKSLLEQ